MIKFASCFQHGAEIQIPSKTIQLFCMLSTWMDSDDLPVIHRFHPMKCLSLKDIK